MGEVTDENVSDFQVQIKPMSSIMPFSHKAIMFLVSLVTVLNQISFKMHPIHSVSNTAINHMCLRIVLLHDIDPT